MKKILVLVIILTLGIGNSFGQVQPDKVALNDLLIAEVAKKSPNISYMNDLIISGAQVDARDSIGSTLLYVAVTHGHLGIVKFLISKGADVNVRAGSGNGPTVLHWAAMYGEFEIVKFLISNGADVNARSAVDNTTTLHWASTFNVDIRIIKFLVSRGAHLDDKDNHGRTALHHAARDGDIDVVKYLISKGANINIMDGDLKKPWYYANSKVRAAVPELEPK